MNSATGSPARLGRKTIAAALFLGALVGLLWVWFAPNTETGDPKICDRDTTEFMNAIALGSTASTLLDDFKKKQIRYGTVYEDSAFADKEKAGEPFEIVATAKQTGFIVARRQDLVFEVDARGLINKKSCNVVFTGP